MLSHYNVKVLCKYQFQPRYQGRTRALVCWGHILRASVRQKKCCAPPPWQHCAPPKTPIFETNIDTFSNYVVGGGGHASQNQAIPLNTLV